MAGKVYYPLFLNIEGRRVVVVGGGNVGLRKVKGLLEAGARVVVVAPEFVPEFGGLTVDRVVRGYEAGDLAGAMLAFAATDSRAVNARVGEDAGRLGIPVNVADAPDECAFLVPAKLTIDGVQVAISTGGEDPRLAARIRREVERSMKEGK